MWKPWIFLSKINNILRIFVFSPSVFYLRVAFFCCHVRLLRKYLLMTEGNNWWLGEVSLYCKYTPQLSHCPSSEGLSHVSQCSQTTWNCEPRAILLLMKPPAQTEPYSSLNTTKDYFSIEMIIMPTGSVTDVWPPAKSPPPGQWFILQNSF